ncbi:MAG: hypothetical protein WCC01_05710 [Acidimicrobiia bacterium]
MKQWFLSLPGPMAVKVVIAVLVALVALVALFFVYDWIGTNLLDTGGTIG